jgi:hypothetical protein
MCAVVLDLHSRRVGVAHGDLRGRNKHFATPRQGWQRNGEVVVLPADSCQTSSRCQ